jgi:membrane-associated protein
MSSGQLALFALVFTGSLLEGEVVLVGFGVLAATARFPLHPLAVAGAGLLGTMVGDQAVYWVGRLSKDPTQIRWRGKRVLSEERRRTLESFFDRHGKTTVFFLRYAFGLRTVGYFFAGALGMSWRGFFVADFLGALTWTGLLVGLGYVVGRPVLRLVEDGHGLLLALPVTLALVLLVIWIQRKLEKA